MSEATWSEQLVVMLELLLVTIEAEAVGDLIDKVR